MEKPVKGDLVLGTELVPDARDRLVNTLLRIYRSYTHEQITALVSRPKPLTLIKGVTEVRARKFMEALEAQGVQLQFVPSAPEAQSSPPIPQTAPRRESDQETGRESVQPVPPPVSAASPPPSIGTRGDPAPSIGFADTPATPTRLPVEESPSPNLQAAQPTADIDLAKVQTRSRRVALRFTGSAGEYFRIWIVNVGLTILTLGIYGPWAKVRTRRYFYTNTLLDGLPFDYLARPGAILKGYLIVGGALIIMNVSNRISPLTGTMISAAAWCTVPLLLYKAHRFKAKYSAYRNIRFRFTGSIAQAYRAYALIPLGVLMGLAVALPLIFYGDSGTPAPPSRSALIGAGLFGLLFMITIPYFMYLQRRYLHDNLAYGKTPSIFRGGARRFYGIYVSAFFMLVLSFFLGGLFMGMTTSFLVTKGDVGIPNKPGILGILIVSYAVFGLAFLLVQQYVYASTFNYSWGSTRLGPITFSTSLKAKALAWIRFTNVLAIVFSLGLLIPWAKIRRARYILPQTIAVLPADMGVFETAADSAVGAVGDTAADFFDWDIGW